MTADVDICNEALDAMGARATISSLTPPDGSAEADSCARNYAPTRDALLRAAHWDFAGKTDTLNLLKAAPGTPENPTGAPGPWSSAQPAPGWLYAYRLPTDCLQVRLIVPGLETGGGFATPLFPFTTDAGGWRMLRANGVRFKVAADRDASGNPLTVINCNQCQALGAYTCRVTQCDLWDSLFRQAMVASLAVKLALPLSGDKALRRDNLAIAQQAIVMARVADGDEGLRVDSHMPEWLAARGISGFGADAGFIGGWSPMSLGGTVI